MSFRPHFHSEASATAEQPGRSRRESAGGRRRGSSCGKVWLAATLISACGCFSEERGPAPKLAPKPQSTSPNQTQVDHRQLVGAEACAGCHAGQAEAHARSGHSRTFASTRDSEFAQRLCGKSFDASAEYGMYEYACDDEGLMVGNPQRFAGRMFPLEYAFGSGDHAVTFLSILTDVYGETIGVEHRATWYRSRDGLGITPGQQDHLPEREIEAFGRVFDLATIRRCIDCHTTTFEMEGTRLHHVMAGVQCEECHGAGKQHVAAAQSGDDAKILETIQLPANADEEIALCGRCHRLPHEFPQERLDRYPPTLKRFQPVGLLRSPCYLKSEGALRCSTCHDPHETISARTREEYTADCRGCHQPDHAAVCPVSKETGCIDCHMQKVELIPGIFFHDHWIRTRPESHASDPADDEDIGISADAAHP